MINVNKAGRVFTYNGISMGDLDPNKSPEEIKSMYETMYPELSTATVSTPELKGNNMVYEFKKAVGTKG